MGIVEINAGGTLTTIRDGVKQNFESLDWAKGLVAGNNMSSKLVDTRGLSCQIWGKSSI